MDMNLLEKADKYAVGKVNEAITNAIAQAYVEGYKAGYKDREMEIPVDLRDNKTEYVDLGLPSGTLWAAKYESTGSNDIMYTYAEVKNLNIPTKEQVEELFKYCKTECTKNHDNLVNLHFLGPNGNKIVFIVTGYKDVASYRDEHEIYFWIKESENYNALNVYNHIGKYRFTNMFTGYRLKARLVR